MGSFKAAPTKSGRQEKDLSKPVKFEKTRDDRNSDGDKQMTYQRIFDLKFKEDIPTYELGRRFPKERRKISRVALLELPLFLLRSVIKQEREFQKLVFLKRWFFSKKKPNGKRKQARRSG